MPEFKSSFTVQASLAEVVAFHHDTQVLRQLTPPLIFVQFHRVEPLGPGSVSDFTLWFGPFPVRWVAVHSQQNQRLGFTDTQTYGPLLRWVHTHTFEDVGNNITRVQDTIAYEHHSGLKGLVSRMLFFRFGLHLLFAYRKFVTCRALERRNAPSG